MLLLSVDSNYHSNILRNVKYYDEKENVLILYLFI